ncbi:WhiB family transcriptional regulator [Streptomyces sp. NPDC056169]|uniref:WhiB family transcriptional regulator n=1 Tax=Streptomyces sp. NPDC056169 TaxID=3345734 RepID=UPI0035E01562
METRGINTEQATDWRTLAACQYVKPDDMFPDPGNKKAVVQAKQICGPCPVWDSCLTDALATEGGKTKDNRYGIRAGLTPTQRYNLHHRNRMRDQKAAA